MSMDREQVITSLGTKILRLTHNIIAILVIQTLPLQQLMKLKTQISSIRFIQSLLKIQRQLHKKMDVPVLEHPFHYANNTKLNAITAIPAINP